MYGSSGGQYGGGGTAASLFNGGGFMPSQTTQTPESSGFSKSRNTQTLLPLTVKQIMDASQTEDKSNFVVNEIDVSTVRLLGRIVNKVERVTDVSFTLDDGTGKIDVNRWESETSDTKEMLAIKNGDYVIVNGGLKGFQGKRHVVAYSVRPVNNFNDITHHFLHCIHVHLELTRSKVHPLQPQVNSTTATVTPIKNEVIGNWSSFSSNQAVRNDMTGNQATFTINQAPMYSATGSTLGTETSNLVLTVFNDPSIVDNEHGVSLDYANNRLKLPEDLLRKIIQDHVEVGNVYSTIDDNHYKSACNG